MNRPGLADLLGYARPGDTLAIVSLDRLGRSLAELLASVTMLRERQIALLSLVENIDTSSAAGELVFHVFGSIAHLHIVSVYIHSRMAGAMSGTRSATIGLRLP